MRLTHRHNRRGVDYTCYRCPDKESTMQLPVTVIRQDIEEGVQGAARKCAVALAVRHLFPWAEYTAATYDYVFVSEGVTTDESGSRHFVGRQETWALDRVGTEMVSDFDKNGRAAIPRIFNITRDYTGR